MKQPSILELEPFLVSPFAGIIQDVTQIKARADEPRFIWMCANPAQTQIITGFKALNQGNAVSTNLERARAKAIGEAVERYCASIVPREKLVLATESELPTSTPLRTYCLYSTEQHKKADFPFSVPSTKSPISWVLANTFSTKSESAFVPASFVFVPYERCFPDELFFDHQISSGLACGDSQDDACLKGLLEVIERDCFMRSWQQAKAGPKIDIESIKDKISISIVKQLKRSGYRITILHIGHWFNLPIFLAYAVSAGNIPPFFVCGCGASTESEYGVRSALEELALGVIGLSRRLRVDETWKPEECFSNITTLSLHGLAYAKVKKLAMSAQSILNTEESLPLTDIQSVPGDSLIDQRDYVLSMISSENLHAYWIDVTSADITSLGLSVCRVIIPGSLPLDQDARWPHLGAPAERKISNLSTSNSTLLIKNMLPHPFP